MVRGMPRRAWAVLLFATACFDPQLGSNPFLCGPADQTPRCPEGFSCVEGVCSDDVAPLADARPGTADARAADARRFDAPPGTPDAKGDAATPDAPLNQECDPSRPTQCDGDVL